jgi:hypothetical protein
MMRIIDELAKRELIPERIDFAVPIIDNYGDMGVSLSLALEILVAYPNTQIRYFCSDISLFEQFIGREHPFLKKWYEEKNIWKRLSVHSLGEVEDSPLSFRYNFFGYRIPLLGIPQVAQVVNFDYMQFRSAESRGGNPEENLHITEYLAGNTRVVHFVPGVAPGTGGITTPPRLNSSRDILDIVGIPKKDAIFIFVYQDTLSEVLDFYANRPEALLLFDSRSTPLPDTGIRAPFIPLLLFAEVLRQSSKSLIRGEHSLMIALENSKPFLWDPYKESNGAHKEKLTDLEVFLKRRVGIENLTSQWF